MSDLNKLANNLHKYLTESDGRKPKPYDTKAEVLRIEGDTVWVKIPGGVDETPVQRINNANVGDTVQVRIANGKAWIVGNNTSPATDDARANEAFDVGKAAGVAADAAIGEANRAREAADYATGEAVRAKTAADHAEGIAEGVEDIAKSAKTAADTAFTNLSQVQSVLEVAQWIATHGTYVKATLFNPNATYYTITATQVTEPSDDDKDSQGVLIYYELDNGIYVRTTDTSVQTGKTYYRVTGTPVAQPSAEYIADYYTLAVSEAIADYIKSHLALTDDGLYIMKDGSRWKVKITDNGVYILDPNNKPINVMTADGNIVGYEDGARLVITQGSINGYNESGETFFDLDFEGGSGPIEYTESHSKGFGKVETTSTEKLICQQTFSCDNTEDRTIKMSRYRTRIFTINTETGFPNLYFEDVYNESNCYGRIDPDKDDTAYIDILPHTFNVGTQETITASIALDTIRWGGMGDSTFYVRFEIVYDGDVGFTTSMYLRDSRPNFKGVGGNETVVLSYEKTVKSASISFGPNRTPSKGIFSSSFGCGLDSSGDYQTVLGKYNEADNNDDLLLIIGNGTPQNYSNAFTVDQDGIASARDKDNRFGDIFDLLRPVGSTYSTVDASFNPNVSWGGTWELMPEGYILLSGSEAGSYIVGDDNSTSSGYKEYGANDKRIENANIAHGHGFTQPKITSKYVDNVKYTTGGGSPRPSTNGTITTTGWNTASGGAVHNLGTPSERQNFNVMQKSIAVYWWIRTA